MVAPNGLSESKQGRKDVSMGGPLGLESIPEQGRSSYLQINDLVQVVRKQWIEGYINFDVILHEVVST